MSQEQNLVHDCKLDHLIGDMGSVSIKDKKYLLATLVPSLRLRDEAFLEPLGTERVTHSQMLQCCSLVSSYLIIMQQFHSPDIRMHIDVR
jgi:hypothetical protein